MNQVNSIKVWDIAVRTFHWSLVLAYSIAWLSEDFEDLHVIAGYTVLGLICFRIIWGFIGPQYARFSDFIYSPAIIRQYLKDLMQANPKHYFGHNPAGGVMVILLLISLFGATLSGLKLYGVEGEGPLAQSGSALNLAAISPMASAYAGENGKDNENPAEEFWEEIHEFFSNFSLFLVILHVLGVLFSSMMENENLVKAMITGRKNLPSEDSD